MTDADKKPFLAAFAKLCLSMREKEPNQAQLKVYFNSLKDLDLELVVMAADVLEREAKWFPKASEWRDAARKLDLDRSEFQHRVLQQRRRSGLPPLCLECDDTGWMKVENRVSRCACHVTRRLEVLGRRPMPELPEHAQKALPPVDAPPREDIEKRINAMRDRVNALKPMPAAGVYLQTEP